MPTHTPSPHRFLTPKATPSQKAKPKPQSSLRNSFASHTPKLPTEVGDAFGTDDLQKTNATPARRFIVAPHRRTPSAESNAHVKDDAVALQSKLQTQLSPRQKPRRKFERVESIHSATQSSPIASQDGSNRGSIAPTVEHGHLFDDEGRQEQDAEAEDDDNELLFVTEERNKRRRVSPPTSPSLPSTSEPTTPHAHTTHRFLVPPPRTPALFSATATKSKSDHANSTPIAAPTPAAHRPAFILPPQPTSPVKPAKPLPEIFSPSRKTQKYVPGGLAATLQGWIIETANTGFAAQERSTTGGVVWGRDREDGVRLKVRVKAASSSSASHHEGDVECYPGHFVFVRGDTEPGLYNVSRAPDIVDNNGEIKVLLAGQGGSRGAGVIRLKSGNIFGIRAPMWDVDVGGEKWMVGVDWVLI